MHKLFFILLLFSSAFTAWMPARSTQGWQTQAWQTPKEQIVVLTNHQTIQGIVQQQTEKVSVRLPSGSLIVLPKSRVLLVGQTLGKVYWELAARTRSTDTEGQIDVYKWCVRNHLFDEAANHLLMLQEMDIPAKTLMQLDVSLKITQKRHVQSQQPIVAAKTKSNAAPQPHAHPTPQWQDDQAIKIPNLHTTAPTAVATGTGTATNHSPTINEDGDEVNIQIDPNLRLVSWEQPISENSDSAQTLNADQALGRRLRATESVPYSQLDLLTRSMPKGAVGLFRKQVEPVIQQACSQCHQSESTENAFKVFQGRNGLINRRMSQKNLFQALNLADRDTPEESWLIRYATVAHGNQSTPSFHWQAPQLQSLKQWLVMVSDDPLSPPEKFLPKPEEQQTTQPLQRGTPRAAGPEDAVFGKRLPVLPGSKPKPTASAKVPSAEAPSAEVPSANADPFDAETFNRRFGAR